MSWITPKTAWITTDKYNIADFNRMKNNIEYLCYVAEMASALHDLEDLGEDITTYDVMWDYARFNAMENNLEKISMAWTPDEIFTHKTFYPGGKFIDSVECSRIESFCLKLYPIAQGWENGRLRLPFRLGGNRKIRV